MAMRVLGTVHVQPSAAVALLASALFLLNSWVAARRALRHGDAPAAAFVAAATVLVAALLATVSAHGRARDERRRGLLKAAAWALSAALTAMFARRVAALAPAPAVAALVWTMAGSTVAGGFYCVFVHAGDAGDRGEEA
ncbi:hypothetical protein BS78_03G175600 [Paspalum vaginatum]|nr:hypothetical protein BS78_03G175600 [Paspalum vaginatum]